MLFYYLAPLQNNTIMTSLCMQFIFGDKGVVYLLYESVLPVTGKKGGEREKVTSALGWNMDMQVIIQFAHVQTEGAAYCV